MFRIMFSPALFNDIKAKLIDFIIYSTVQLQIIYFRYYLLATFKQQNLKL